MSMCIDFGIRSPELESLPFPSNMVVGKLLKFIKCQFFSRFVSNMGQIRLL